MNRKMEARLCGTMCGMLFHSIGSCTNSWCAQNVERIFAYRADCLRRRFGNV